MIDNDRGLYEKYIVIRNDGQNNPGGKHYGCYHFVLDVTHDKFAIPALKAYADACQADHPRLAEDLRLKIVELEASHGA